MNLPIPSLQDIVRLTGPNASVTADNYRHYLARVPPSWGYSPAKRTSKASFSLEMTREAAVAAGGQIGPKAGWSHNREVGGLVWDLASKRGQFMCFDLPPRWLSLRPDFRVKVDPQFFFIENGRPVFFYLQPRQGRMSGVYSLRLISSAIHTLFAVDEFSGADLLLVDLSKPEKCKERAVAAYSFADLPPLSVSEMEKFFQRFVDAYDIVSAEGVVRKARRPRPTVERGDGLFGDSPPA
jgi:hypothetical protein